MKIKTSIRMQRMFYIIKSLLNFPKLSKCHETSKQLTIIRKASRKTRKKKKVRNKKDRDSDVYSVIDS